MMKESQRISGEKDRGCAGHLGGGREI